MAGPSSPISATSYDCDLRAAVQATPSSLVIGYEFRNRSSKTAFLFNVVHRTGPSGGPEASADLAYTLRTGPEVTIAKRIVPVPANIDVEKPDVPYVTRVEPGGLFREKFTLPLPLKLWNPYPGPSAPPAPELAAYFELGFFLAPDPSVAKEAGGHLVVYPFNPSNQIVLRAGPLGRFPIASANR